ncbi:MAG: hypothetical protein JOZ96_16585 [Acidobacteria bacterium]|nr:hypothetical protein [Acidobacteriota bacterium]
MSAFVKTNGCPTAEELTDYSAGRLAPDDRARVVRHLSACDFCGAASHLLAAHRPAGVDASSAAQPPLLVLLLAGLLPGPSEQSEPTRLARAA